MQTTSFAAGSRARVTPSATMRASQKIGAPAFSARSAASAAPVVKTRSSAVSTMPQAWMTRTATLSSSGEKRESLRLAANDGEGAAVDRRAVLFVRVGLGHASGLGANHRAPCAASSASTARAGKTGLSGIVDRPPGHDEIVARLGRDQRRGGRDRPGAALGAAARRAGSRPRPEAAGAPSAQASSRRPSWAPCRQAGAPGHAATRRRLSPASRMKPSLAASLTSEAAPRGVTPTMKNSPPRREPQTLLAPDRCAWPIERRKGGGIHRAERRRDANDDRACGRRAPRAPRRAGRGVEARG